MSLCINADPEPKIEHICGFGADPRFDQLISALGHISRQKPKPLIDTIMYWRKAKGEAANNARAMVNQVGWSDPHCCDCNNGETRTRCRRCSIDQYKDVTLDPRKHQVPRWVK